MPNEEKNIFIVIIILLVVGCILYYYNDFFTSALLPSVFQPETKFLSQYAGTLPLCCGYAWLADHPYSVSQSMEAVITDYKIVVATRGSGQITAFRGCKENTCNGKYKSTDEYGCDYWSYSLEHKFDDCGDVGYQCVPYSRSSETITCEQLGGVGDSINCQHLDGCIQYAVYLTCTHTCGGAIIDVLNEGEGCYSDHKVYYKGNLVYETGTINSPLRKNFREGIEVPDTSTADLHIDFHNSYLYFSSPYDWQGGHASKGCSAVINEYLFNIPSNSFIFNIDIPEKQLIAGENITAEINITNNWMDTSGRLDILVNIPYKVFGEQKQTSDNLQRFIDVKKGKNTFYFKLPTEQVTNMIYVTPTFYLLLGGNKFKGVNFYCFEQGDTKEREISTCKYVSFGTLYGDKFSLDVIPSSEYNESIIISLEEKIRQLELTSSEQAKYIKDLDLTISQQAEIIKRMQSKVEEQATIINNMELTLSHQADLIDSLNLGIDEQLIIINNLNTNLAQKIELVNQLEITNEEQQFLINQMRGSFAEQAGIIRELNLTIEDDAKLIKEYKLSLEGEAEIISELRLTIDEMAELINLLELSEKELVELVNELKLTNLEKEELINKLKLSIQEQQEIIDSSKEPIPEIPWLYIGIGVIILIILYAIFSKK